MNSKNKLLSSYIEVSVYSFGFAIRMFSSRGFVIRNSKGYSYW